MTFQYTKRELTEERHTADEVLSIAAMLLNGIPVCTNALHRRRIYRCHRITTAELNEVVKEIVEDSRDYACTYTKH